MARCPRCGEPVSQFAAGCAVCGTDLEAARREHARRRARRPSFLRWPRLPSVPDEVLLVAILTLVVLTFPVLGIVLVLLSLRGQALAAQGTVRYVLIGLALLGGVFLLAPQTRYGVLLAFT